MSIGWRACARPDGRADPLAASHPDRREERGDVFLMLATAASGGRMSKIAVFALPPGQSDRRDREFVWRKNHNDLKKISSCAKRFWRRATPSSLLIGHDTRDR